MTFAFWIRRANIERLAREFGTSSQDQERLGLGLVLHFAPSNVPINFAFSYVFGLLAGNSGIVRVASPTSPQVPWSIRP